MIHKHHIIPRHMGGTDDPSNLVELSIEEHAEAHHKLFEEYGHWQDKIAWLALAGRIEDVIKETQRAFFTVDKRREWSERMRRNRRNGTVVNKPNINAKTYRIIAQDGAVEQVHNLRAWARNNGHCYEAARRVATNGKYRKTYKGYRIEQCHNN